MDTKCWFTSELKATSVIEDSEGSGVIAVKLKEDDTPWSVPSLSRAHLVKSILLMRSNSSSPCNCWRFTGGDVMKLLNLSLGKRFASPKIMNFTR